MLLIGYLCGKRYQNLIEQISTDYPPSTWNKFAGGGHGLEKILDLTYLWKEPTNAEYQSKVDVTK